MEPHLQKIKFLLNLAKSPNENEAAAAAAMAQRLIAKFNVTDSQLSEIEGSDKPIYTDDNLLHESSTLEDWKKLLALIVTKKYDCYAIQEDNIATTGEQVFKYYVYGDPEDVVISKELFKYVYGEIDNVIKTKCAPNRGKVYRDSFCEGLIKGVRDNIEYEDFAITGTVRHAPVQPEVKSDVLAPVEKAPIKPPAIDKKIPTKSNDEKPIDIMAFFIGESLGKDIHIDSMKTKTRQLRRTVDVSDTIDTGALSKALEDAFEESDWGEDYDD
jgi:hypothetical protein